MPIVLHSGPYRLFFYASDAREPAHVHIQRDRVRAKIWLVNLELEWNLGFSDYEVGRIIRVVRDNLDVLLRRWNEFFTSGRPSDRFRPDYPGN